MECNVCKLNKLAPTSMEKVWENKAILGYLREIHQSK